RFDGPRNSSSQFLVAHDHVIKSAVRFDVVRLHAYAGSNRLKNAELISDGVEYFRSTYLQFFTSEILAIEKTWMRSDGDSVVLRGRNCGVHRIRIARVKTGRDICRADELEQFLIVTCAFAEVHVDIDG